MTDRPCPKCGGTIRALEPTCTNTACITKDIIHWTISPEGYLTYIQGCKYPLRALPVAQTVNYVAILKRAIIATLRPLQGFPLVLMALCLTPKRKVLLEAMQWLHELYVVDYAGVIAIPENAFCTSAREIKRSLTVSAQRNGLATSHWITLIQTIYETDLAYRYRIQNILEELDKDALVKHPRREIMRLLQLNIDRELVIYGVGQREKAMMAKRMVMASLFFADFRSLLVDFLLELDIEKIKMDLYDRYWVCDRFDYNYNGITYEQRQAWRAKEHENWSDTIEPLPLDTAPVRPAITINKPNDAFFNLPPEGAKHMAEQVRDAIMKMYDDRHV